MRDASDTILGSLRQSENAGEFFLYDSSSNARFAVARAVGATQLNLIDDGLKQNVNL